MKCKLLYSDTDSFLYETETKDLYQDLAYNSELRKHFDFSNSRKGTVCSVTLKKRNIKVQRRNGGQDSKGICLSKTKTLLNSYRR